MVAVMSWSISIDQLIIIEMNSVDQLTSVTMSWLTESMNLHDSQYGVTSSSFSFPGIGQLFVTYKSREKVPLPKKNSKLKVQTQKKTGAFASDKIRLCPVSQFTGDPTFLYSFWNTYMKAYKIIISSILLKNPFYSQLQCFLSPFYCIRLYSLNLAFCFIFLSLVTHIYAYAYLSDTK